MSFAGLCSQVHAQIEAQLGIQTYASLTITHGFWMGRFEVTEGEYRLVTGKDPDGFSFGDDYPAVLEQGDDPLGKSDRVPRENDPTGVGRCWRAKGFRIVLSPRRP